MKLEQQVTSLELSKKLKDLGFKQESLFYWKESKTTEIHYNHFLGIPSFMSVEEVANHPIYSAYTVAELGEMLPDSIRKNKWWFKYVKSNLSTGETHHVVAYEYRHPIDGDAISFAGSTEADARARTLIYLTQKNLI